MRTKRSIYVIEVKLQRNIGRSVIREVQQKVERLNIPNRLSVRTGLIYEGKLDAGIEEDDYFDALVSFGDLLEP